MKVVSLNVGGSEVKCSIKEHAMARSLNLRVTRDGKVTLTVPKRVSSKTSLEFLNSKVEWIEKALQKTKPLKQVTVSRVYLRERVEHFAKLVGVTFKKITVKEVSSRWGSCSSKGNLNFSRKMFGLTPELFDYIVLHEVAHLVHLNHSKSFWDLIYRYMPDYAARERMIHRE